MIPFRLPTSDLRLPTSDLCFPQTVPGWYTTASPSRPAEPVRGGDFAE